MKIVSNILSPVKVLLFPSITLGCYLIYLTGYPIILLLGSRYEPWRNICMRMWGKLVMKLFSMNLVIEGTPPDPPFFIVSNHLSYIDIPVYAAVIDTTFVSKIEIKSWPVIGFMSKTLGIIFIDRRKKSDIKRVNNVIADNLNDKQGVLLFPEGTTSPGVNVLKFRPSLLQHAAESDIKVSYASIRYETSEPDLPAYQSVCWWGNKSMLKHLFILSKNRKVEITIRFGSEAVQSNDRKLLAEELHKNVSNLFEPVTSDLEDEFVPLQF